MRTLSLSARNMRVLEEYGALLGRNYSEQYEEFHKCTRVALNIIDADVASIQLEITPEKDLRINFRDYDGINNVKTRGGNDASFDISMLVKCI